MFLKLLSADVNRYGMLSQQGFERWVEINKIILI